MLSTLADWELRVPGHPDEVEEALEAALGADHNVYVRLAAQQNARALRGAAIQALRVGSYGAPSVLVVGPLLDAALAATEGLDVTVLYTSRVKPWDLRQLAELASGDLLVLEPYLEGTSAAARCPSLATAGASPSQACPHEISANEARLEGTGSSLSTPGVWLPILRSRGHRHVCQSRHDISHASPLLGRLVVAL